MTEEAKSQDPMEVDQEEGEILEDGEIADDEDDIVPIGQHSVGQSTATKDEKENKESNKSKMGAIGSFSSYFPLDRYLFHATVPCVLSCCNTFSSREDHFKPHKRKKKNNSKKRKRSNSNDIKRKQPTDLVVPNHNAVDISNCLNDSTFDTVDLSDEDEYNFDQLEFDVLLEILGCTADKALIDKVLPNEKSKVMLRIIKIMKQLHGNGIALRETCFCCRFSFLLFAPRSWHEPAICQTKTTSERTTKLKLKQQRHCRAKVRLQGDL